MISIPWTIPLWTIFRIEPTEMCPSWACHTSMDADTTVAHETKAVSTSDGMYLVMYTFSMPLTVQDNQYNPLDKCAMPIGDLSALSIWHSFPMNWMFMPRQVSWLIERRLVLICGQKRTSLMIAWWSPKSLWIIMSIWPRPTAWMTHLSPRIMGHGVWRVE